MPKVSNVYSMNISSLFYTIFLVALILPSLETSTISSASSDTTMCGTPVSNSKRKLDSTESLEASAKRPKNDQLAFKKHSQFWALDGNILQIDLKRFKLHKSRLAVQSLWFDRLFQRRAGVMVDLSNHEEETLNVLDTLELVDQCDFYNLNSTGVTVGDFVCLLTAMDNAV